MAIYNSLKNIPELNNIVLTIGTFDGVHLGHQALFEILIGRAKETGSETMVITFNPHPQHIIEKGVNPKKYLTGIDEKVELIKKCGVDHIIIIPFDLNFSKITADDFLNEIILSHFNLNSIVVGHDHQFGFKKKGDIKFLNLKKEKYRFEVIEVNAIYNENMIISSSLIRKLIESKNIDKVNLLLGRKYSINGTVIKGDRRGRLLGFPTANIKIEDSLLQIPQNGVYFVQIWLGSKKYFGICNVGFRPTFNCQEEKVIEVYIFINEYMNLYGKELKIEFIQFIRDEKKFESKEKLIDQIKIDKSICQKYLVE